MAEEATENTKEGRKAIEEATPPSCSFKEDLPLPQGLQEGPGPEGEPELADPSCARWHQLPAGKQAVLAAEGRGLVLFFPLKSWRERVQPLEPGQAQLPPTRRILPVLGKHTWLEFSCHGPGAQSFLPSRWSGGEIKCLAESTLMSKIVGGRQIPSRKGCSVCSASVVVTAMVTAIMILVMTTPPFNEHLQGARSYFIASSQQLLGAGTRDAGRTPSPPPS